MTANNCTSLPCFIPELGELADISSPKWGGSAHDGCLFAVNQSLNVISGELTRSATFFFETGADISDVQDAALRGTICNNDNGTAPEVLVPYTWCTANIPGWHIAGTSSGNEWVGPLVQFILPCVAFCYNVPRQWKFEIPSSKAGSWEILDGLLHQSQRLLNLLPERYDRIGYVVEHLLKALHWISFLLLALSVVIFDTVFWISVCFAYAGPMTLSATYEYLLDWKILRSLATTKIFSVLTARLLLCSLAGNLKIETKDPGSGEQSEGLTWLHVMELIPEAENQPQTISSSAPNTTSSVGAADNPKEEIQTQIKHTVLGGKAILQALVHSQPR